MPNARAAIERFGALGGYWIEGVDIGDPLADAAVADIASMPPGEGMALVLTALDNGIDSVTGTPASIRALLEEVNQKPDWLDRDTIDRAVGHLARHRTTYTIALGTASMTARAMNSAATLPLRLSTNSPADVAMRSTEVLAVLDSILEPGGLSVGEPGFVLLVVNRIRNALLRRYLTNGDEWDLSTLGVPVPQSYMAFTVVELGHLALAAMHRIGVRYTPDELDDIYHLWRYVGSLTGVASELNPIDEAAQKDIEALYALTAHPPTEDDRSYVRSLMRDYWSYEVSTRIPLEFGRKQALASAVVFGLVRAFRGRDASDRLEIPRTAFRYLPMFVKPIVLAANRILVLVPGATRLWTKRATELLAAPKSTRNRKYEVGRPIGSTIAESRPTTDSKE